MIHPLRRRKGSVTLEMLANLPILLIILTFIIEGGFIMYDWAVINYATASAAVNAAANGGFSEAIRLQTADYLQRWTSEGKDIEFYVLAEQSPESGSGNEAVVWGTDPEFKVQRGEDIEVGVYYPIKFKVFIMDALSNFLVQENHIALRAHAVAPSEVYFEDWGDRP